MFGRSRELDFASYSRRRKRARVPRWLLLLLFGVVLGIAAVLVVQQRYLPPRLSASESAHLRDAFDSADAERRRLQAEVAEARGQLEASLAQAKTLAEELALSRATTARLRDDVAAVVESLPPDPRGGQVEVRSAQFVAKDGMLNYDIVLLRDGGGAKPLPGLLRLVVAGESARGVGDSVTLEPVALSLGRHEIVRGSAALPEGFKPRQTTVQVLDRDAGNALGMRILRVR